MLYHRGKGRYREEYKELRVRLVPSSGQADTVQGELVRSIGRLGSEFYRNGNGNWDMGFRLLTNFLYRHLRDGTVFDEPTLSQIEQDIADVRAFGSGKKALEYAEGEDPFDRLTDRVVEWCQRRPEPIANAVNPKLRR